MKNKHHLGQVPDSLFYALPHEIAREQKGNLSTLFESNYFFNIDAFIHARVLHVNSRVCDSSQGCFPFLI